MTDDDEPAGAEERTGARSSERATGSLKAEPERVIRGECMDMDIDILCESEGK